MEEKDEELKRGALSIVSEESLLRIPVRVNMSARLCLTQRDSPATDDSISFDWAVSFTAGKRDQVRKM